MLVFQSPFLFCFFLSFFPVSLCFCVCPLSICIIHKYDSYVLRRPALMEYSLWEPSTVSLYFKNNYCLLLWKIKYLSIYVYLSDCFLYVLVQHVRTISSNVRTQVAVYHEAGSVIRLITVEIALMKRTAVSDNYRCIFAL